MRAVLLALAVLGLLLWPGLASAAPSPALLARQAAALTDGTAILQVAPGTDVTAAIATLGLEPLRFRRLPLVAVKGSQAQLRAAAALPGVLAAHMDEPIDFDLHESTPLIFEGAVVQARAQGLDGHGVNVAVVDSGVDGLHPDLEQRVVRNVKVLDIPDHPTAPQYVECPGPCNTDTSSGHGSHVAGIAVGDGSASEGFYTGVAPRAGLVGLGVGDGASIFFAVSAFDYLLDHPELGVAAVNNSWGESQAEGHGRYDSTNPVNVATRALADHGIAVVFSAGNTSTGSREDPPGASECDTVAEADGTRAAGDGICRFSVYGSAQWAMAAAMGRKDGPAGRPGEQYVSYSSSRGDPVEQISLDGEPVTYLPTLTAPGVNVRSVRDPNGPVVSGCVSAEPPACQDVPRPEYEPYYTPLSGTSMAAPQITGAVAVLQSAAQERLGRLLSPPEVRRLLTESAAPMTGTDGYWDWPCGSEIFVACGTGGEGTSFADTSGSRYEAYQAGAGHLDLAQAAQRLPVPLREPATATAGATGTAAACADALAPRSTIRRAAVRASRRRLALSGAARDAGCGRLARVNVAVARVAGSRCRFLDPRGRAARARSCARPRYLPARGTAAWSLRLRGRLLPGRYRVWARATDAAGNAERRPRRPLGVTVR